MGPPPIELSVAPKRRLLQQTSDIHFGKSLVLCPAQIVQDTGDLVQGEYGR